VTDKALHNYDKLAFKEALIYWYEKNKRDLPWRKTTNPYYIWVSEIMLQQTKVDTVIDYYKRFLQKYPTIIDLAEAEEQDVLKVWEGLGYYSRARNLHAAAKEVVERYNGIVPNDPSLLGELKGIGPYTKGAVSSIAFGLPEPAVDGNVMRVLSRVLLIQDNISESRTRKRFEHLVRELICHTDPSAFNQGLMELGALICTPTSPACLLCPVQEYCRAFDAGVVDELPVKQKKKKQRVEQYVVLLLQNDAEQVAIEQRPSEGLLANMWQFPMIEKVIFEEGILHESIKDKHDIDINMGTKLGEVRHIFSHIIWELEIYAAETNATSTLKNELQFVDMQKLSEYPISVSHLKIKEYLQTSSTSK